MSAGDAVWTFADFEVGADLGSVTIPLDDRRIDRWNRIYGGVGGAVDPGDAAVPRGLIIAAMMEGYIGAIQPRPPGNIHAGQTLTFTDAPVRPGAQLGFGFTCKAKEIRRERRWLTIGVQICEDDRLVAEGEISSIWAK